MIQFTGIHWKIQIIRTNWIELSLEWMNLANFLTHFGLFLRLLSSFWAIFKGFDEIFKWLSFNSLEWIELRLEWMNFTHFCSFLVHFWVLLGQISRFLMKIPIIMTNWIGINWIKIRMNEFYPFLLISGSFLGHFWVLLGHLSRCLMKIPIIRTNWIRINWIKIRMIEIWLIFTHFGPFLGPYWAFFKVFEDDSNDFG